MAFLLFSPGVPEPPGSFISNFCVYLEYTQRARVAPRPPHFSDDFHSRFDLFTSLVVI
jgi:hypothetical protein